MFAPLLLLIFLQNIVPSTQHGSSTDVKPNRFNLEVRVKKYINPFFDLGHLGLCVCNEIHKCEDYVDKCRIKFGFAPELVPWNQTYQSDFGYLNRDGLLSRDPRSLWTTRFNLSLAVIPQHLLITAEHTGSKWSNEDKQIHTSDDIKPFDLGIIYFAHHHSLKNPTVRNKKIFTDFVVQGAFTGSTMYLQLSFSCIDSTMIGQNCDLKCTPSYLNNSRAICKSTISNEPAELYEYTDDGYYRHLSDCSSNTSEYAHYCHSTLGSLLNSIKYVILLIELAVLILYIIFNLLVKLVYVLQLRAEYARRHNELLNRNR